MPRSETGRGSERAQPDPVEELRRWETFGGAWRVLTRDAASATVSLCRCDGGEELQQLTSSDPELLAWLGERRHS